MKTSNVLIVVSVFLLTIINLKTFAVSNNYNEDGKIKRIVSSAVGFPKNSDINLNEKSTVAVDFKVNSEAKNNC